MSNKSTIRVAEFEKLYYNKSKPFKQKHWEALCRYQDKSGIEYYRILNKGVQFTSFVGVIQAGNLTIEILPKIDRKRITAANISIAELQKEESEELQSWHNVLLQMLKECSLLRVEHVDYASLNLKSNSILEIYLELFLLQTEKLLREGLIRKYRKEEGNKLAMKGQLLFHKNISQNLVHRERFYTRYTEYNRANIFNQLLYKTLCLIPALSDNPSLSDKVNRLLLDFPEMPDCKANPATFENLGFGRKTERYKEAMLISKMLLLNYRPDITGGSENVMAILFDMNKLWEEFVYRRLKREEIKHNIHVQGQLSKNFWKPDLQAWSKKIKPDIVIRKNDEVIVVDTKWKIVPDLKPGDDDLKQMFVYNLFWRSAKSVLLYPANSDNSNCGMYHDFRGEVGFHTKCQVETISIFDAEMKLDKELGSRLIKRLII